MNSYVKLGTKIVGAFCTVTAVIVMAILAVYFAKSPIILAAAIIIGCALALTVGFILKRSITVSIYTLVTECGRLAGEAREGKLDARGDISKVDFEFQGIIQGMNDTLDAVIGPLNVAAEYIDRISKGDIPPRITDTYYGDFNEIKNNLNSCIDAVAGLLKEVDGLIHAVEAGRLDTRGNVAAYAGDWGKLVGGMNGLIEAVANPVNELLFVLGKMAINDLSMEIVKEYAGAWNDLKNGTNAVHRQMAKIQEVMNNISHGSLIDLDGLKKVGQRSKNDELIPAFVRAMEAIHRLVADTDMLAERAVKGDIHTRADAARHEGDFSKVIEGVNNTLEIVAKPVEELLVILKQMAVNDLSRKMDKEYTGIWDELKHTTNDLNARLTNIRNTIIKVSEGDLSDADMYNKVGRRSEKDELVPGFIRMHAAIQKLLDDAGNLAATAVAGQLDARADAGSHEGEYRNVIESFNKTLDAIIGPLNVAAEYIDRISKGNIPLRITDTYYGDFNEIKNNVNGCIDVMNGLLKEMDNLIKAAQEGKLDTRGNAAGFAGGWGQLINGMNGLIEAVGTPINELNAALGRMAVNDYTKNIVNKYAGAWEELKSSTNAVYGQFVRIHEIVGNISRGSLIDLDGLKKVGRRSENDDMIPTLVRMIEAIQNLVDDSDMLAKSAVEGKLETREDLTKHDGDFRKVVEGINNTLDAVINPINEAAGCLKEMAEGNLDVRMNGNYQGDHAIIKNALNTTLETLNDIIKKEAVRCLREIARGNLDVEITGNYQGDYAIIKDTLNTTISDLNETLGQVYIAIEQVNTGAQQVSDSSQVLSQGAAESASAVEEITSSMQQMNVQTKQNAENATQANQLSVEARTNAERGNDQMSQMVNAMADINESASNISNIIKAIDEIAFQTNLLALNAAVEAARAGKHGKGFTVVAEEVRNLAQRSAKAAKETAEMIEGSIKKTEMGARIAEDTSKALEEIVKGSVKVTDLISEIASASKEQAKGIEQINEGLCQVDQVTQQNSASSEELASSSEEMSSQANIVRQMIGKFKLRWSGGPAAAGRQSVGQLKPDQKRAAAASGGGMAKPRDIIPLDDVDYGYF